MPQHLACACIERVGAILTRDEHHPRGNDRCKFKRADDTRVKEPQSGTVLLLASCVSPTQECAIRKIVTSIVAVRKNTASE